MRGLTLTQPWATLVAIGEKRIETRSWATSYRGRVAIHAGKGLAGMSVEDYCGLCRSVPHFGPALHTLYPGAGYRYRDKSNRLRYDDPLPRGAIVAVATLLDCVPTHNPAFANAPGDPWYERWWHSQHWQVPPPEPESSFGDYSPGRYAWLLSDVRRLARPIPWKGALGLWAIHDLLQLTIEDRLKES